MKEIEKTEDNSFYSYFAMDYENPLTDYVYTLANKLHPANQLQIESGYYVTKAYGYFTWRYLEGEIDKSFLKKYENDEELLDMITALGYDVEKFWFLLLFINDYSYCACKEEVEFPKTPNENLNELCEHLSSNIKNIPDNKLLDASFKHSAELTLKIDGRKKITIEDPRSLMVLIVAIKECLEEVGEIGSINKRSKSGEIFTRIERSNSYQIWYFARLFLLFFELNPPKNIRRKKDSDNSYSTKLLISKLAYLVKLSYNDSFNDSEYTINGFLKQYKEESIEKIVVEYCY